LEVGGSVGGVDATNHGVAVGGGGGKRRSGRREEMRWEKEMCICIPTDVHMLRKRFIQT